MPGLTGCSVALDDDDNLWIAPIVVRGLPAWLRLPGHGTGRQALLQAAAQGLGARRGSRCSACHATFAQPASALLASVAQDNRCSGIEYLLARDLSTGARQRWAQRPPAPALADREAACDRIGAGAAAGAVTRLYCLNREAESLTSAAGGWGWKAA